MWIFYFLFWTAVSANEEPLYRKIGDKAVLTPDSDGNPITMIRWKHGTGIAMQWFGDETLSYRQFRDRGSLDISTGAMTITGLTRDLSGIYTAEINSKETTKTELLVISPVSKPNISVSCDTEMTSCIFSCDGSTTDAEPVTYWWTADEKRWPSTKEYRITKKEKESWFSCSLENPVSFMNGEKIPNPFIKTLYRKVGDKAVLRPDSVENPITSIKWKRGHYMAMEWFKDKTSSYQQFKDRSSLDISTGVMTITGLTQDDSGIYTAEINNKETTKTELLVISPVSKPTIYKSCNPEMTSCVFSCDGSTTDAEPVTYWWTAGEKTWNSTKELRITEEEEEQWFICTLENPVSSISSERVSNPFMESDQTWLYILIAIIGVILVVILIIIYFKHKKRKEAAQTLKEMAPILPVSNQVQTSDVTGSNSNAAADSQRFKPVWQYEGVESGDWCDFIKTRVNSVTSDDIEKRYQENHNVKMQSPGLEYELNFKAMTKFIMETRRIVQIRRVLLPTTDTSTPPPGTSNETKLRQQWQFSKGKGGWCDFRTTTESPNGCSVTNDEIERRYQEDHLNKICFTVNNYGYELDFKEMIQINLETGNERRIRFVLVPTPHSEMAPILPASNQDQTSDVTGSNSNAAAADSQRIKPVWQYLVEESGDWYDFIKTRVNSVTSDDIEKKYQENHNVKMQSPGLEYELDFKAMTKTNLKSHNVFKMRRVLLPPQRPAAGKETSTQDTSTTGIGLLQINHGTELRRQWQFSKGKGGWCDFGTMADPKDGCSVTNDDVEKWYQKDHQSTMPFTVKRYSYELDFKAMIRINLETGNERRIRFVLMQ